MSELSSQTISGYTYNEDKETISGAIITALNPENNEIIDYTLTDSNGFFAMSGLEKGNYRIVINAIGYNKIENLINVNGNFKSNYTLKPKEQKIEEVILTASKPIKIKSDTIEINAKSFLNGTEKNVEDLLKKLPGVTVESDGKIKVQGKEIEKIMVENDDFFERGYTLLTKNMSVQPVEKVQILQNYSNNKLLKGVENSDKVAINLTLEDDAKRDWFGNATLSSTFYPETFYSEKINLVKFGKIAKYFLLGSTNTIGTNTLGDITHLIRPSIQDEPGFINIDNTAYRFGADSFIYLPFGSEKAKFNNDKLVSANTIVNLNKKMKLKLMSLGNFEKFNFSKISNTQFNLADKQFTNIEEFYRNSKKSNYFNKLDFDYDISKQTTLKYSGNYNFWKNNKNENQNFNGLPWNINQKTDNHSTDNYLLLTTKFNGNLVWLNGVRYLNEKVSDNNASDQFFFNDLYTDVDENDNQNFNQISNSKLEFLGVVSQILYRTENENLWDLSLFNYNTKQNFDNIMSLENDSLGYFFLEDYQNDFKNRSNDFGISLKQTSSFKNVKINPQLDIHYFGNYFEDITAKSTDFFYFIPSINISWAIHNKGKLKSSLFLSRNSTGIMEMLPNYFSDTPRSLIRGIGNFDYLKNSGATLKYSYGNWNDRVFINLFGSYIRYHNYLSYKYEINQKYTISDLLTLKNRNDYLFSSEVNYYLRLIHSNFKIIYTAGASQYEDQIDDSSNFRKVFSSYNKIGFNLKTGWKKNINFSVGTNLSVSKIKTHQTNKILNQQAFLEFLLELNDKTNLELKNNYYSFNGYFNKDSSYNFLDFKIIYQYDNDISFSLIGNNIFNIKKFKETSITSLSTYTVEYSLFPRYIMLEMNFRL